MNPNVKFHNISILSLAIVFFILVVLRNFQNKKVISSSQGMLAIKITSNYLKSIFNLLQRCSHYMKVTI